MKFFEFEKKMLKYPVFTSKEVKNIFFDEPNILVQIAFWTKKGYIKKIEKGLYVMANAESELNPMVLVSKIYSPSYLSLEFALNYYGIIPDVPGIYTCVASRKTMKYENHFGIYSYHKIKKELFFGYQTLAENNTSFSLATPEKALLDYLYLNKGRLKAREDFWREMRIDEEFEFDLETLESYEKIFNNKKVSELLESLLAYQKNA